MGVVAANGVTSGASIFFMATGAAVALAVGAVRVSNGEMELRPLLIVLMLGVEVFRPMRELTNLYHQGMAVLSPRRACSGLSTNRSQFSSRNLRRIDRTLKSHRKSRSKGSRSGTTADTGRRSMMCRSSFVKARPSAWWERAGQESPPWSG